jgi:hypothetical protein
VSTCYWRMNNSRLELWGVSTSFQRGGLFSTLSQLAWDASEGTGHEPPVVTEPAAPPQVSHVCPSGHELSFLVVLSSYFLSLNFISRCVLSMHSSRGRLRTRSVPVIDG